MSSRSANQYMLFIIVFEIFLSFVFGLLRYILNLSLFLPGIQIFSQVVTFILPFVVYLVITKRKLTEIVLLKKVSFLNIVLIVLMMMFAQPLILLFSAASMFFFENNVSNFMETLFHEPFALLLITLAVTPAICEELTMRGVIQAGYKKVDVKKAALINGLFFGMMHLDPQQFLYAAVLGAVFYVLVYYTQSILSAVLAHFLINGIQISMAYVAFHFADRFEQEEIPMPLEMMDEKVIALLSTAILAFFAVPFFVLTFVFFIKHNQKRLAAQTPEQSEEEKATEAVKDDPVDIFFVGTIVIYLLFIMSGQL